MKIKGRLMIGFKDVLILIVMEDTHEVKSHTCHGNMIGVS